MGLSLRSWRTAVASALAALLIAAPAAGAASPLPVLTRDVPNRPAGFHVSSRQALAIVAAYPQARRMIHDGRGIAATISATGRPSWVIQLVRARHVIFEAEIDGARPAILSYGGYLEGGHFGNGADAPWVWVLFCLAFAAPFFDPRRLGRLLHLDILVLLSFVISTALLTRGRIDLSVPLAYPPLLYLAGRMLLAGRNRRAAAGPAVPYAPTGLLAAGAVALLAAQGAIAVWAHTAMDVGYFSLLGADRIMAGNPLYIHSTVHGDTYGVLNYLAYVPFEQLWPVRIGDLAETGAIAAALTWNVLICGLLLLLGRRLRPGREGLRLGVVLAYAWAAFPYAMYTAALGTNDGLATVFVLGALLALGSAPVRGGLLGLAAAVKFAPAALLVLFARGERWSRRAAVAVVAAFGFAFAFPFIGHTAPDGVAGIWRETIGFQLHRTSNFSPWGNTPHLHWLHTVALVAGALILLTASLLPGRRDLPQVAAFVAAATIAVQLPSAYWFTTYLVWSVPFVLIALVGGRLRAPDLEAPPLPSNAGEPRSELAAAG